MLLEEGVYFISFFSLGQTRASLVTQMVKNLLAGDVGSIPGLGRSSGKGKDCTLQYSGQENPMDGIDSHFHLCFITPEMLSFPRF